MNHHSPNSPAGHFPSWLGLPHQRRGKRRQYGVASPRQTSNDNIARRYYFALVIIALITLACFNMAIGMAAGLPTNPDVTARLVYLSEHALVWQFGWLTWMAAAFGLLTFCMLLSEYIPVALLRKLGVTLVALGIAPDISAEVLYAFVLPDISHHGTFLLIDRIAMLLTGFVGNGAYCLGGLLLNVALFRNPGLSRPMLYFGLPSWLVGLLISLSTALDHITLASLFTAVAMVWNVIWMFWFTQTVLRHPREVTRYVRDN